MELLSWSVTASFNAKGRISPRPKSLSKQPVQCWVLEMMVGSTWFQDKQCYHDAREVSEQGFKGGCTPCPSGYAVCCRKCVKQLTENGTGLLKNVWQWRQEARFPDSQPTACYVLLLQGSPWIGKGAVFSPNPTHKSWPLGPTAGFLDLPEFSHIQSRSRGREGPRRNSRRWSVLDWAQPPLTISLCSTWERR